MCKYCEEEVELSLVKDALYSFMHDYTEVFNEDMIVRIMNPDYDYNYDIAMDSDLSNPAYLYRYGLYVGANETGIAAFLNTFSDEEMQAMADTYTEGYRMGFVATQKDLSIKTTAEVRYPIGFERMVRAAVKNFEKLGVGLFVHFGLYSVLGKGEWAFNINHLNPEEYKKLANKFNPNKNWAKNLAKTAKKAGAKYITLTTRHHDGYSLFDTKGLSDYDAVHTAPKRDLIREFVDACNMEGIIPFFYHTLMDWDRPEYKTDFNKSLDYLIDSVEVLCKNYGKIGGFWFDGMWDKKTADWQEDRLYGTIRKYQPEAMIINNTGLSELGKLGHPELDSVTFERGKPRMIDKASRYVASERIVSVSETSALIS